MIKRFMKNIALTVICAAVLCGCSILNNDTDSMLSPPKSTGELYEIRQALEKSVNEEFSLKYPTSGEYRSAIIMIDLNNDGVDEATAFYSTVKDNVVSMHINYISNQDEKWKSIGSLKCIAAGVESVDFKDVDNDGIREIIVGWSVYGDVDKTLGVYSVRGGRFTQRVNESYVNYLCEDFNADGRNEIFLTNLNRKDSVAAAKFMSLEEDGQVQLGTVELDAGVSGYAAPVCGKLPNGNTGVYVDAVKGAGIITEVLEINGKTMKNALINEETGEVTNTFRTTGSTVRDIDGDEIYEIPMVELITQGDETGEGIYRTDWHTVTNGRLLFKVSAIMNYSDGYFIIIPEKWKNRITVTSDNTNRIRSFMRIDENTGNSADVLIRVQTIPKTETSRNTTMPNAKEIVETEEFRYFVSLGQYNGEEAVTLKEFKSYFKLIK